MSSGTWKTTLGAAGNRLRRLAARVRPAYCQVFGIPDYQRYLVHMAAHHPDQPPLSRREFACRAIERKYGGGGPRCC